MDSVLATLNAAFGKMEAYYESYVEVLAEYIASSLPDENAILAFVSSIYENDTLSITISDQAEDKICIHHNTLWVNEYKSFREDRIDETSFTIKIQIDKCHEQINIYCYEKFCEYFEQQSLTDSFKMFCSLFHMQGEYVTFKTHDTDVEFHTKFISFCRDDVHFALKPDERNGEIKKCNDASSFLDLHTIALVPQDFHIIQTNSVDSAICRLFRKAETVLSYALLATTAYIHDNMLVLQIEPGNVIKLDLNDIEYSKCICSIFEWAFSGDLSMERASIVRNVMKLYCRTAQQLLNIDSKILTSIKSNYSIYQKDTTEKYIELKEKIADYIVSTTIQLQELLHGLVDGIRNNFVAVVTFVITVLLTNSLTGDDLWENKLPQNLLFVSWIFIVATTVYWIATMIAAKVKWGLIQQSYDQLKDNYRKVLDETDLEEALNEKKVITASRKKVYTYMAWVSILWFVFILLMVLILLRFSNVSPDPNIVFHEGEYFAVSLI